MDEQNPKGKKRVIIIKPETTPHHKTTAARGMLYQLIVRFRRDAEQSDDVSTRTIFEVAVEMLSGLALAFRQHEAHLANDEKAASSGESSESTSESSPES